MLRHTITGGKRDYPPLRFPEDHLLYLGDLPSSEDSRDGLWYYDCIGSHRNLQLIDLRPWCRMKYMWMWLSVMREISVREVLIRCRALHNY